MMEDVKKKNQNVFTNEVYMEEMKACGVSRMSQVLSANRKC